jgi:two-component system, sensor histidine kinase and response regulator
MTTNLGTLLIVDDETAQLRALCDTLELEHYAVRGFSSARQALAELRAGDFDLLLTDLKMPEMDGITLIGHAQVIDPSLGAIIMTGHGTIDTAVLAMQGGALDYILKPFKLNVILPVIARALTVQRLRRDNEALQRRERERSEELAAAYQALESFSYSISHDLRSPLMTVDGFAKVLEEDYGPQLDEQGRDIVRTIHEGCQRMDQLIVGLLAFSQAGRRPFHRVEINMSQLARAAAEEAMSSYAGPAPLIEIGELPACVGDATVIRQVWCNLIGNALKYSARREQPRVEISGRFEELNAIYRVQDNGAGFDMNYADKLFGVFQRLHGQDEFAGTGVGLAIAHRIVVRHGGRIWANSEAGSGACFEFALPMAAESPHSTSGSSAADVIDEHTTQAHRR